LKESEKRQPGGATKIFRQQVPALREAIQELSHGRVESGFDNLDALASFTSYRRLAHQDSKQTPGLVGDFKILFSFAASRIFRSMTTILTYSYKLTHNPA
jgi:hypothetical protein